MSNSLWPHGLQQVMLPWPPLYSRVCSNSCPLSQWCYLTVSSSVTLFSCCLQSFPSSGSFPMRRLFASGGQSTGASDSASVLPMNVQDWLPLGLTGLISLLSKGHSRVFSSITVQKHQFFSAQLSLPTVWERSVSLSMKGLSYLFFSHYIQTNPDKWKQKCSYHLLSSLRMCIWCFLFPVPKNEGCC